MLINVLSPYEIYEDTTKIYIELPVGSYSNNNGVFIPIPSYLYNNTYFIQSHWIYVSGVWNGNKWLNSWSPIVSSYLTHHAKKEMLYVENEGYWMYDNNSSEWIWSKTSIQVIKHQDKANQKVLNGLNTIKFPGEAEIYSKMKEILINKQNELKSEISSVLNKERDNNSIYFNKIKSKINNTKNLIKGILNNIEQEIISSINEENIN